MQSGRQMWYNRQKAEGAPAVFGYVQADRPEMKVKEFETYRAYYCGLCRALKKRYGQISRLTLSYDASFLYLLAASQSERVPEYEKKRCPVHPARRHPAAADDGAAFAAAVNVLLAAGNLRDDVADEKKISARAGLAGLARAEKKARRDCPEAAVIIDSRLAQLRQVEARACADLDAAADPFGGMLGALFELCGKEEAQRQVLRRIGYQLGRWIYLIDAYADRKKDEKSGAYNPFLCRFGGADDPALREEAQFALCSTLRGLGDALDLLEFKKHGGIIENILRRGLYRKTEEILATEGEK